jgi:Brp/Blh family beta-carotene 15,15'-monooxygenase
MIAPHQATWAAVSAAALIIGTVAASSAFFPELNVNLVIFIVGLVFVGIPHGALDIFLLLKTLGRGSKLFYGILIYLALAAPMILLWPIYPSACFLFFIVYSLFHFADSDAQGKESGRFLELAARIPLPFCVPYVFHKEETLRLVQWVHSGIDLTAADPLIWAGCYVGAGLVAVNAIRGGRRFISNFPNQSMTFLEPLILFLLFAVMPPLYSLATYFCFVHSVKHLVNIFANVEIRRLSTVLPFWLVPLVGLPFLFFTYFNDVARLEQGLFQYSIILLSAVALPHAILVRYVKSIRMIS